MLAWVADGDDLSRADLARAVLVRPQSISRLIGAIADQGLVARTGRGLRTTLVSPNRDGERSRSHDQLPTHSTSQPHSASPTTRWPTSSP